MDQLTRKDLESLLLEKYGTLVSLYLPTGWADDVKVQGRIRLRNLIKKATDMLSMSDLRAPELSDLLAPARRLLDDALFWQYQYQGLALFISPRGMRVFRLSLPFGEQVFMAGRFHRRPCSPSSPRTGISFSWPLTSRIPGSCTATATASNPSSWTRQPASRRPWA
jgi:hypothetical protein